MIGFLQKYFSISEDEIWEDENGVLWQIETLQVDYLKFNKYKYHDKDLPKSGTFYHVKNAVHQEPIKYYNSLPGRISPFYDKQTQKLDFKNYLKQQGFENVDVVYADLGGNGLMRTDAQMLSRKEYCKIVVKEAKVVVDLILEACPNAKIKLMTMPFPSLEGGLGNNYGAEPPFNNYLNLVNYHFELCEAYQEWCKEEKYKNSLELVHMSGQFDSENNYPFIEKPVNTRSSAVEKFDINGGHPAKCGYMQMADAIFRNLVKEFYSEK
jgi:lysophospholipase L1-like esterase